MKYSIKLGLAVLAGLFSLFMFVAGIGLVTGHYNLFMMEYFGTRQQNVQTEIFKNTEMYREAKVQQLADLRLQYIRAESEQDSNAIASTIRLRHADDDADRYPEELTKFLIEIRGY